MSQVRLGVHVSGQTECICLRSGWVYMPQVRLGVHISGQAGSQTHQKPLRMDRTSTFYRSSLRGSKPTESMQ